MSTTKETLKEEIIANARRDRKRLESVADGLVHGFANVPSPGQDGDEDFNPDVAAAFAEEIAKIGDSLTRVNQQLVELVKIEEKKEAPISSKLGKGDIDDVYESIKPQECN